MNSKQSDRRRFLKNGAALALAVGGMRSASGQSLGSETPEVRLKDFYGFRSFRALGERSRFETPVRAFSVPPILNPDFWLTPVQDLQGIITPSALHYQQTHSGFIPDIDPRQHRFLIHGLVDRPLIFTLAELKRLPSVSWIHFIECAGNTDRAFWKGARTIQDTHGRMACSEWTGVPLSLLLREAGVQKGANWLVAEGAEPGNWNRSIPLEKAMDDVLVAYAQNGEAVRPEQGYPMRLVVPGWHGNINVKWLRRIKVVDQPYLESIPARDDKGRFKFEMGVKSVITFPSAGQRLPDRGFYQITGLAWSPGGAIRRVEVSADAGRSWKDAELQEPVHRIAHTRFRLAWNWDGEEAVLQSRSTDERGDVQPTLAEWSRIRGVKPDYWKSNSAPSPFNPVFSWEVTRDGSVHIALL